jgi:hypothetical protein
MKFWSNLSRLFNIFCKNIHSKIILSENKRAIRYDITYKQTKRNKDDQSEQSSADLLISQSDIRLIKLNTKKKHHHFI